MIISVKNTAKVTSTEVICKNSISGSTNMLPPVKAKEAIHIFQVKHPYVALTKIELNKSLEKYFYEVEGVDNTNEYKMVINANTKAIKSEQNESLEIDERNDTKNADQIRIANLLSDAEVSLTVFREVGEGQVLNWELEKELNIIYWEVKFQVNINQTNVRINTESGEVLEIERDE